MAGPARAEPDRRHGARCVETILLGRAPDCPGAGARCIVGSMRMGWWRLTMETLSMAVLKRATQRDMPGLISRLLSDKKSAADHRERDPVDLAVERKADQLDCVGERIPLAHIVEHRAALLHPPQGIERG